MAKRIIQMKDKHHSTTYEYPIINKDCLGEDVKEYIEAQAGAKIDDTTTSATKVWSSDKTNTEVEKAKDKGIYATITAPTVISINWYSIAISDLIVNANIPIQQNDLVIYVDQQNVKAMSIFQITTIIAPNVFLTKLGDFGGGGKQLYQHNIHLSHTSQVTEYNLYCTIISDRDTAYDFASLTSYLQEQVPQNYGIVLSGKAYYQNDNVVTKFATRIYYSTNQNAIRIEFLNTQWTLEYKALDGTITDRVNPL